MRSNVPSSNDPAKALRQQLIYRAGRMGTLELEHWLAPLVDDIGMQDEAALRHVQRFLELPMDTLQCYMQQHIDAHHALAEYR